MVCDVSRICIHTFKCGCHAKYSLQTLNCISCLCYVAQNVIRNFTIFAVSKFEMKILALLDYCSMYFDQISEPETSLKVKELGDTVLDQLVEAEGGEIFDKHYKIAELKLYHASLNHTDAINGLCMKSAVDTGVIG